MVVFYFLDNILFLPFPPKTDSNNYQSRSLKLFIPPTSFFTPYYMRRSFAPLLLSTLYYMRRSFAPLLLSTLYYMRRSFAPLLLSTPYSLLHAAFLRAFVTPYSLLHAAFLRAFVTPYFFCIPPFASEIHTYRTHEHTNSERLRS